MSGPKSLTASTTSRSLLIMEDSIGREATQAHVKQQSQCPCSNRDGFDTGSSRFGPRGFGCPSHKASDGVQSQPAVVPMSTNTANETRSAAVTSPWWGSFAADLHAAMAQRGSLSICNRRRNGSLLQSVVPLYPSRACLCVRAMLELQALGPAGFSRQQH